MAPRDDALVAIGAPAIRRHHVAAAPVNDGRDAVGQLIGPHELREIGGSHRGSCPKFQYIWLGVDPLQCKGRVTRKQPWHRLPVGGVMYPPERQSERLRPLSTSRYTHLSSPH